MTDQDIIKKIIEKGVLDERRAKQALEEAGLADMKVEEVLYEKKLVDEEVVAGIKSELLKVPYKVIDPANISKDVLTLIPYSTSQTYRVVPLERKGDMLIVGMLYPDDPRAQEALRFVAKQARVSLGVYLVTPSGLSKVWRMYSPYQSEINVALRELNIGQDEKEDLVALEGGAKSAEEAPIIKIVASTLKEAVSADASDVHIEPQRSKLRIRFRINGALQEIAALPVGLAQPIISRIKVLARLRLDEARIPQDGRFRALISGKDIDFRISTFPTPTGEKVALRVLDPSKGLKGLAELGLESYHYSLLEKALSSPYGMILISGPTGSGKTTTLYAMLQKVNSEEVNIVSLEDPVEYFMDGINQSQVRPEIGYDFASGLRQILRQDPDVIMVGEVRDGETASLAVNAALTGHLMFSTIHTNNAVGVIPRLLDLGVPGFLLSSALNLMLAQRLVSRLCDVCKVEVEAPREAQEIIQETLNSMAKTVREKITYKPPYKVYTAEPKPDCEICKGKGIVGRLAVFEMLEMTNELSDLINSGFTENKLWEEAKRQGIVTLREDGMIKVLEGKVRLEEVLKETEESSRS